MTGNRERCGSKVVTFRVPQEVYEQLELVKGRIHLSNADLMKLGAQVADEQVEAKLAEVNGLETRLTELRASVEEEQWRLEEFLNEERKRRIDELDTQIQAFRLFDCGWNVEEVSFKLDLPEVTLLRYLQEWGEERNDKPVIKRELLRACLKTHIDKIKNQRVWARILPSTPQERIDDLDRQITDCQRLLAHPSRITKKNRDFLLAEYSPQVLSAIRHKSAKSG